MRKNILAISMAMMLVAPISLMAQIGNFTLSGKIGNLNAPAKAFLIQIDTQIHVDTSAIINGQFEFKGSINEPFQAFLVINREDSRLLAHPKELLPVYLEQGTINVNSPDSLQTATITGSKINVDNEKLQFGRIA